MRSASLLVMGMFLLALQGIAQADCGDDVVDPGEQCDLGADNGAAESCCTATCQLASAGTVCRPAVDECDAPEYCSGVDDECPDDASMPEGTVCGDPTATACHAPDTCDDAGFCQGNDLPEGDPCPDDGSWCTADVCDGDGECTHPPAPQDDCATGTFSRVTLSEHDDSAKNHFQWKFASPATSLDDYGDPTASTSYELCVFDQSDGDPVLVMDLAISAGGDCGGKPCWKGLGGFTGFAYLDKARSNSGVRALWLRARSNGTGYIFLKGNGDNLPVPDPVDDDQLLCQDPAVQVQLINDEGACWGATYSTPAPVNKASAFRSQ